VKIINTFDDIATLRAAGQHAPALLDLLEMRMREVITAYDEAGAKWDPDEYGAFALVEKDDGADAFAAVGINPEGDGLVGVCWEFCQRHTDAGTYEVLFLFSNDGGWTLLVPDAPWLDAGLRAKLEAEATVPYEPAPGSATQAVPF
jgi:hypothetical protein